jgi:starch phosphorylase
MMPRTHHREKCLWGGSRPADTAARIKIRAAVGGEPVGPVGTILLWLINRRYALDGARMIAPSPALSEALLMIETGFFSRDEPHRFAMLTDRLRRSDDYMVVADFDAYWQARRAVDALWRKPADWAGACIRNIAGMGWFSADRAINEYARSVWRARF